MNPRQRKELIEQRVGAMTGSELSQQLAKSKRLMSKQQTAAGRAAHQAMIDAVEDEQNDRFMKEMGLGT